MSSTTSATTATSPCLGELLKTVAVLKFKSSHIKSIIQDNCKVQQGDTPPFKVDDLYEEYLSLIKLMRCTKLQIQQHNTLPLPPLEATRDNKDDKDKEEGDDNDNDNNNNKVEDSEVTMMRLLARKDTLSRHLSILSTIVNNAYPSTSSSWKKIKDVSQVDVAAYEAEYQKVNDEIDALLLKIQKLNWR